MVVFTVVDDNKVEGAETMSILHCDSCDEVIELGEKYWLITSVGRELPIDPENIDYVALICLMCAPHGFEVNLGVNE